MGLRKTLWKGLGWAGADFESFSGREDPEMASRENGQKSPCWGQSLIAPRRLHCAAGSGPPSGGQPCSAKTFGVATTSFKKPGRPCPVGLSHVEIPMCESPSAHGHCNHISN